MDLAVTILIWVVGLAAAMFFVTLIIAVLKISAEDDRKWEEHYGKTETGPTDRTSGTVHGKRNDDDSGRVV